uniref:Uncharacterized protein n=1 Tax=Micrurus carvalhoi TaxID=3147026 RepID=A0A2H6MXT7_9SAUR
MMFDIVAPGFLESAFVGITTDRWTALNYSTPAQLFCLFPCFNNHNVNSSVKQTMQTCYRLASGKQERRKTTSCILFDDIKFGFMYFIKWRCCPVWISAPPLAESFRSSSLNQERPTLATF